MAAARKASVTIHALSRRPVSICDAFECALVVGTHLSGINLYRG